MEKQLDKLGIRNLREIGQCLVSAKPDNEFRVQGNAKLLDETEADWGVSGQLTMHAGTVRLDVVIEASKARQAARGPGEGAPGARGRGFSSSLCNLTTQITAPPGHTVILGATPTQGATSVFVVQVVPAKR